MLVCSSNPDALLLEVAAHARIAIDLARSPAEAREALNSNRYEAVLFDYNRADSAREVVNTLRSSPANCKAIVLALTWPDCPLDDALMAMTTFVLEKPLQHDRVRQALWVTSGLALERRRRNLRCFIDASVRIVVAEAGEFMAEAKDLSEEGLCVRSPIVLSIGQSVRLWFKLPNTQSLLEASGEVVWVGTAGVAGIRFGAMSKWHSERLSQWLDGEFLREFTRTRQQEMPHDGDESAPTIRVIRRLTESGEQG